MGEGVEVAFLAADAAKVSIIQLVDSMTYRVVNNDTVTKLFWFAIWKLWMDFST